MVGLSNLQKEILKIFSKIEEQENFYLTGGTALSAFYLHHRLSEDLDLFTPEEPLINIVGERFRKNLESENFSVNTIRRFSAFFEMVATKKEEGVRIQLALDSPFRFEEPEVAEIGVKIDSLIDIATNKLLTVFGRAEVRDFVDFLLEKRSRKSGRKLRQDWAGALEDYRGQYTSLELQKKALEWRGD